jgi:histidine kinase-like protein
LPNLVIANAQLAVTEAAANAVRHSGCIDFQIQGRMSATTLIVVVSDQGPGRPYPDPGGGLGTGIIRELAAVASRCGFPRRPILLLGDAREHVDLLAGVGPARPGRRGRCRDGTSSMS